MGSFVSQIYVPLSVMLRLLVDEGKLVVLAARVDGARVIAKEGTWKQLIQN